MVGCGTGWYGRQPGSSWYVLAMVAAEGNRDDVREELRTWLEENWDRAMTVRDWWALMSSAGWQFPTWPRGLGGRDLSASAGRVVAEEVVAAGALGPPFSLGQVMGGPVVIQNGNDEQRARLVPPLADGTESWCQFFSEPGAGSDLAGLRTAAERDGDEWIINGQKVWTSGARAADRGMLVARTDFDQPKHRGMAYFIIELDQPGIEVRPLKQMNGEAHFNEVFFTDARVHNDNLIGGPGDGWASAVATLAFERAGLSSRVPGLTVAPPGAGGGILDHPVGEVLNQPRDIGMGERSFRSASEIGRLVRERGLDRDPNIRQALMDLKSRGRVADWSARRARATARAGQQPGPFANLAKLAGSDVSRRARDLGPVVLGPAGMLAGPDGSENGQVTNMVLSQPSASIAGGSDEIQRNIIGERGLGLPKDIQVDRDIPFREVPK